MAADLVATHSMMDHIGRFLPSVRCSGAAFSFVVNLIINYGSPVLHLVMVRQLNGCFVTLSPNEPVIGSPNGQSYFYYVIDC
jgi:hypothetical protein